jgi:hypothetical protein
LAVDRTPSLFTGDFGDCLGGQSLFNITKFDAAYYADNLTIVFHLDGTTNIKNENLMMHISVDAYGKTRYAQVFDPCSLNIDSLCPLKAGVPITGWARIPVGPQQVGGIPDIAFVIPDFEGSAKIQIFANSSKTEIGCFQAAMQNGASFSQLEAVPPVLGIFTLVTIAASFVTAAYGISVTHMRSHFAHSLPVLVVFDTFQTIFLSGALAVNWPSVLVAWRSNFAWSAGLIYTKALVNKIDSFAGVSGNASQVGGAGSVVINNGGGLATQIYGRSLDDELVGHIVKRFNENDPYDYTWAGNPVTPGMPTPGTWVGLPGTLSSLDIPSADAFLIALIWSLVAIGLVMAAISLVKWSLEGLAHVKWIAEDRLEYFRGNWLKYLAAAVQRTLLIIFFAIFTLALYQFNLRGPVGVTVVAVIASILALGGVGGLVYRACHTRLKSGHFTIQPDQIIFHHDKIFKVIPCIVPIRASTLKERELEARPIMIISFFRIAHVDNDKTPRPTVHEDTTYIEKYGWLSARYRRTRWYYFAYYVAFQVIRACFLGGAVRSPLAQVYGLLIFELGSFLVITKLSPFEGARNTAIAVWMLSILRVLCTGLSIAFLPSLNIDRIVATAVGIVIIVIQGLVVVGLIILVILGSISSYMSLTRNREEFTPESWNGFRTRYFEKIESHAPDTALPPKIKEEEIVEKQPEEPQEPYFSVTSVRRAPKIEDEDNDILPDMDAPPAAFDPSSYRTRNKRTSSVSSRYSTSSLPRQARALRASWSSRDFSQWENQLDTIAVNGTILESNEEHSPKGKEPLPPLKIQTQSSNRNTRGESSADDIVGSPRSPVFPPTPSMETLKKHADERQYGINRSRSGTDLLEEKEEEHTTTSSPSNTSNDDSTASS